MSTATPSPPLRLARVSKSYAGSPALDDVSFECRAGEVHALVGENGSGKSTLIKIASGVVRADRGQVLIGGKALRPAGPRRAKELGLLTAYQDTSLVLGLSVADNFLLAQHGATRPSWRRDTGLAARSLAEYDLPWHTDDLVSELSPGERQLLEVVRLLAFQPRVLVLDEPTAGLDAVGAELLENIVDTARSRGVGIVYVTHRLGEIERLADRISVLRSGRIVGEHARGSWDRASIVDLMVGVPTSLAFPPKAAALDPGDEVLRLEDVCGEGFGPVDLSVRRGEIVGLAGAEGNGQRRILRACVGAAGYRGTVEIEGERTSWTPGRALRAGAVLLSGDRHVDGMFPDLPVMENAVFPVRRALARLAPVSRTGDTAVYLPLAGRLGIVASSRDQPVAELSGGNQQKAVVARAMDDGLSVVVIDEPTQGVDAGARLDIHRALRDKAASGSGILLASSDAAELAGLCDRVLVVSRGRIVRELRGDELDETTIVEAFVTAGHSRDVPASPEKKPAGRGGLARLVSSPRLPVLIVLAMTAALALYAGARSPVFWTAPNMIALLTGALPLIAIAIGQQGVLLTGGFDLSVGSAMTLSVVLASFWISAASPVAILPGVALVLLAGAAVGLLNWFVVGVLRVDAIIGTIATLSVIQGIATIMRPLPGGAIGQGLVHGLSYNVGPVPVVLIVFLVLVVAADLWLRRTLAGLTVRATGMAEEAVRRSGARVVLIRAGGFVFVALMAAVGGLLLASQLGLGSNSAGATYVLAAFTACFLGGANLTGGRGSFLGATLGAVFLTLLINVAPLLDFSDALSELATGVLLLAAVILFSLQRGRGRAA
ncbi:ATP-binding cassette domain-containing protein [Actinocorallia sp. B10E7]|uniref:ATP-binding cassette domain-containing protein n=1 Tax=Actinocorallia sp. B10E7 TaxID=3153558 RepID=UPI00325D56F0